MNPGFFLFGVGISHEFFAYDFLEKKSEVGIPAGILIFDLE